MERIRVDIVGGSIPVMKGSADLLYNDSFFLSSAGKIGVQGKLHMTNH
jgi:hypothetical protein